jgi:hypothetical protein
LDFWTLASGPGGAQEIQFTLTSIAWNVLNIHYAGTAGDNLSFLGVGVINDLTDPSQFHNMVAALSGSFTQANLNSAVNASFTLEDVPEPATYGFIAGLGLLGFGLWHRRNA